MTRYLILNADDYGLTEGVSRGILRAHHEGILTSTTFMANFPWAPDMAAMLKGAPDLGVGIHLNLTTGRPILPPEEVASLVNGEGTFAKTLLHIWFRVDLAEARREWSAQVERGIALLGRTPTHVDTHRYLQALPGFAEAMVAVAQRFGIPAVRCVYPGSEMVPPKTFSAWNPAGPIVQRYLQRSAQVVAQAGIACPQSTMAGDFDVAALLKRLDRVRDGVTEIVCHPGEVDDQLRSLSSLQDQRSIELAALTAPEVRQKVEALGIERVSFGHFASGPAVT